MVSALVEVSVNKQFFVQLYFLQEKCLHFCWVKQITHRPCKFRSFEYDSPIKSACNQVQDVVRDQNKRTRIRELQRFQQSRFDADYCTW